MHRYSGDYGTHPLDKNDPQAREAHYSSFACANCGDDLQVGTEVWAYVGEEEEALTCCSVGCLAMFTVKFEADIDEFEYTVLEE